MPIIELTMEQSLKMRIIEDQLKHASRDDIVTVFLALQKQCFVLGNNMSNLVKLWPTHPPEAQTITEEGTSKSGTS
jgi:hypothetical protein